MLVRTSLLVAVLLTLPLGGSAQEQPAAGDRIRVESRGRAVLVGTLSSMSSEFIVLSRAADDTELWLPVEEVVRVERSLGRQRQFGRNFGLTLLATSALGGLVGAVSWSPCTETGFMACFMHPDSRSDAVAWGLVGGVVLGLPVGLIVGLSGGSEAWEPLSLPETGSTRVTLSPIVGSRLGVTGSISFGGR